MQEIHQWSGIWINTGKTLGAFETEVGAAPCLRKEFTLKKKPKQAMIYLCGLGYHVLYVNGKKADDRVLAPVVTQYTERANYVTYDVTSLLRSGKNAIAAVLGNGWYNCSTENSWKMQYAPWRDYPKLLCDVVIDGTVAVKSDRTWKFHDSPITFDALRNGEFYDARLEIPGFAEPGLDDSDWKPAAPALPPPGVIEPEELEPCKIMEEYPALEAFHPRSWVTTYDFGRNLSGFCRLKVRGAAGTAVHLYYTEKIDPVSHAANTAEIDAYVFSGKFQCDHYTLKGDPAGETWEPSFTYHGFRYVMLEFIGEVEVQEITACFVHTAFKTTGKLETSDPLLNRLLGNALQSYRCNFVGIPTDCPHREKNGWTGDTQITSEAGMWNFGLEKSFSHFVQIFCDTQRKSGQFPGIAPTGGWGFNWGAGVVWDALLFEVPWRMYLFYGNTEVLAKVYDPAQRYLEFCSRIAEDHVIAYGLGDWMHSDHRHIVEAELLHTAYYRYITLLMSKFAAILGHKKDAKQYADLSEAIRARWQQVFYRGKGSCGADTWTGLACAVYFDLLPKTELRKVSKKLAEAVRANAHKADFGFIGAKLVPRALAMAGYAEDAFRLYRQEEFPGWIWPVKQGATTLWEYWSGQHSQNHFALSDVSAWMYQYAAGIAPDEAAPGFRHFTIAPVFPEGLNSVKMHYDTAFGTIRSEWRRSGKTIRCKFTIPAGTTADVTLNGTTRRNLTGSQNLTVEL